MRKLLFCLAILIIWQTPADSAFLKESVEYGDLVQLSAEGLETLNPKFTLYSS